MARKQRLKELEWQAFFEQCLENAVGFEEFATKFEEKRSSSSLNGDGYLEAWAYAHDGACMVRARQVKYLEQLMRSGALRDSDALKFVAERLEATISAQDSFIIKLGPMKGEWKQCVEAVILEQLAYHMVQCHVTATTSQSRLLAMRAYTPLMSLISLFTRTVGSLSILAGPALAIGTELAKYVLAYINELHILGILNTSNGKPPKVFKKGFNATLPSFAGILANTAAGLSGNLLDIQRQAGLFESSEMDQIHGDMANDLDAMAYQQNIMDVPLVATRAALYIYLNAMLTGRPLCDDTALFTYLNTRYSGTVDKLIADLITASFDVLANAINRTEPAESMNIYRSFLINKLPVLLESFSNMIFPPSTIQSCITDALQRMDSSTDPFSTQTFDLLSSSGMISEARQEFLFACALWNLIPESSIETILGDVPMQSLPESGKYSRAVLVSQCTTNSNRVEELIRELEDFGGNSSEVAAALVEIIQTLCAGKDSVTLKGVCNALLKRTQALDVLLLFVSLKNILQPLCELLDKWQDPEDQSEYHPVYDEFGSIFFLILVLRQRFDVGIEELHITDHDSFVRGYILSGCVPLSVREMSDSQQQKLGGWVKGLYDSDGISDELMSTCSPKEFHMLVATLFDQTLKACQSGVLGMDAIKNGFEYLLEPFLLPSLITALGWATRVLWSTQNPAPHLDHLLPLLTLLIRPPTLSSDAAALHEAVLSVAARPLERSLAHVQKFHPRRRDIDPLLNKLKSRVQSPRSVTTSHTELETWCTTSGSGGFPSAIRHTLHALVAWSATGSLQSTPTSYTHKQILMGIQMLGAPSVLEALLNEATKLAGSGSSPEVVLDVVSALICAPTAAQSRAIMSLQDALSLACEDAFELSKSNSARAEFVVRLQRRVEAQSPRRHEEQTELAQDTSTAIMMDAAPEHADGQIHGGILKEMDGNLSEDDFMMDTGTDGDASALFGM